MKQYVFFRNGFSWLLVLLLIFLVNDLHAQPHEQDRMPNVLLIVVDDLGWNDVGYHGSEIITPTIDRLAKEGVELNRFYVHPTCSPTRSALMTGKAPLRLGFLTPLGKNNEKGLPISERTMAEYFQESGYQTSLIGKWHLGRFSKDYWPYNRGFDHFYGYLTGGIGHYDHVHGGGLDWQRNGESLREEGYSTQLLTDEAVKVIKGAPHRKPFFMELCFAAPHLPNEAPETSSSEYQHLPDENRKIHASMVTEVDKGVKRILQTLEEEGLLENTIIWFTSDNGGLNESAYPEGMKKSIKSLANIIGRPMPTKLLEFMRTNLEDGAASNLPFRAGKGSTYEGGIRVPAFIYAPRILVRQRIESRITINDVLPTLASAVNMKNFDSSGMDGVSQWKFLKGEEKAFVPDFITHGAFGDEAYFKDEYKLLVPTSGAPELYHLLNDPSEEMDISAENQELVFDLMNRLDSFPRGESVHDPMWKIFIDMDEFGGEEDRLPYAGLEGVNSSPIRPMTYMLAFFVLGIIGVTWMRRLRVKSTRKLN